MVDFLKNIKQKIALRRGYVGFNTYESQKSKIKFKTRNSLEYDKVQEKDGEQKFLRQFLDVLKNDDILFDVGANIGLFSLSASTILEDQNIYAFEPVKTYCNVFLENMDLNRKTEINIFNFGLGDEEKKVPFFYKDVIGSGMGSSVENYDRIYEINAQKQYCIIKKGDMLIRKTLLPVPNVIKIDVEGMELEVLKGLNKTLQRDACRWVFCEVHTKVKPELYVEVCRTLQKSGFEIENVYAKKEGIGIVGFK